MSKFKSTDFVQVEHHRTLESGEPVSYWRNALYVGFINSSHVVIYTDGSKEQLRPGSVIRRLY